MSQKLKDVLRYSRISMLLFFIFCFGVLNAKSDQVQAQPLDPLKVGLLLPFTGQYGWVGSNVASVVQILIDDINNAGGIGNHRIDLYYGDTEGVLDVGLLAAHKLINADGVLAVIGPTSLSFTSTRQVILDTNTPMISPTAGTTQLDRGCMRLCFRTVSSDSLGGQAIVRAAIDGSKLGRTAGFTKVVLMIGRSPSMLSFEVPIRDAFRRYDTPLALVLPYTPGKVSYRSEITQAIRRIPELIILIGTPEDSARIMLNAYQAGYAGTWFVTQDQTTDEYLQLIDPQVAEGMYGLNDGEYSQSIERTQAFEALYHERTNDVVKSFGTNTYDAMNVLALAMLHAYLTQGTVDREHLAISIPTVANHDQGDRIVTSYLEGKTLLESGHGIDYQGLVGPLDFDEYGNIRSPFHIRQVHNGQWHTIATITPEEF